MFIFYFYVFSGNVCHCPFTAKQRVVKLESSIIEKAQQISVRFCSTRWET